MAAATSVTNQAIRGGERGSEQSRPIPRAYVAHFRLSRVFVTKPVTTQTMVGSLRNDEGT